MSINNIVVSNQETVEKSYPRLEKKKMINQDERKCDKKHPLQKVQQQLHNLTSQQDESYQQDEKDQQGKEKDQQEIDSDNEQQQQPEYQQTSLTDEDQQKSQSKSIKRAFSEPASSSNNKRKKRKRRMSKKDNKNKNKTSSAPFNTTQFLMNDHGDTIQYLDNKFGISPDVNKDSDDDEDEQDKILTAQDHKAVMMARRKYRVRRARHSSFCVDGDSGSDFYYSEPEDEEEFLSKEFAKDYNSVRTDRLVAMSKGDLIEEYLQMEVRIETLEGKLSRSRQREQEQQNKTKKKSNYNPEIADKIRIFQLEIQRLQNENRNLQVENRNLRAFSTIKNKKEERIINEVQSSSNEDDDEIVCFAPLEENAMDTGYDSSNSAGRIRMINAAKSSA